MLSSKIVVKNSAIGIFGHMVSMIFGFVIQKCFLYYLGLEILGVNGVIAEMLGMLSLAELGVGGAITYRLYKPLVEDDEETVASLMKLYSFLYNVIGVVVFVVGNILLLFLPFFMKDITVDMSFVILAYYIQLITTASTYFFAYKRSLLYVEQKQYVCKIIDMCCNIMFCIFRILALVLTQNYVLYLVLMLLQSVLSNIIVSVYCDKHYPFLKRKNVKKFTEIKEIFKDTKEILLGKLAGYVYSNTDNLVISRILGVTNVGSMSNYKIVTNSVKNLMSSMTDSIMATVGNFIQMKDREEAFVMLKRYTFARYVVVNVAAAGLIVCTDTFVAVVYGEQYLMTGWIPVLIVIDIFISMIYGPLGEFDNVLGYFSYEKWIHFIGAALNLGSSILLAFWFGIEGVLLGTCLSQLFFWVSKSILLCSKYFQSSEKWRSLWVKYIAYVLVEIVEIVVIKLLCNAIFQNQYTIFSFIMQAAACVVIPIGFGTLFFGRTDEYKYFLGIAKRFVSKKAEKKE